MKKSVKEFYEFLVNDEEAQKAFEDKAKEVSFQKQEEIAENFIIPFAKEKGYEFTIEDIRQFDAEGELTAEELEAVSGGGCGCFIIGASKKCGCFIAGKASNPKSVACSVVGY